MATLMVMALGMSLAVSLEPLQAAEDAVAASIATQEEKKTTRDARERRMRKAEATADRDGRMQTYLGVVVVPVPPALAAHLPGVLGEEEGLLVSQVEPDSPASKAGLQVHDVLIGYDDQKILSVEQFLRLIRNDEPGRAATLKLLRAGKPHEVHVTLGETAVPKFGMPPGLAPERIRDLLHSRPTPPLRAEKRAEVPPDQDDPEGGKPETGKAKSTSRNTFHSVTVRQTGDNTFRAEVDSKDESGKLRQWSFEGTRDEIREALDAAEEIPEPVRNRLRQSLESALKIKRAPQSLRLWFPGGGELFLRPNMPAFEFPRRFQEMEQWLENRPLFEPSAPVEERT